MDKLQVGMPLTAGKFTLIPVEYLFIQTSTERTHGWLAAYKKPYAIVVYDSSGIWALSLEAKQLSLEHLFQTVTGLESLLASLGQ